MLDETSGGRLEVEAALARIEVMRQSQLKEFWRKRWGYPPGLRSAAVLRYMIAWRLQSAVYGGLRPGTLKRLQQKSIPRPPLPAVGTRLTREYQGRLYEVEVRRDGIGYAGQIYGSLSEVARVITGTRWNGPRFFGLREPASHG